MTPLKRVMAFGLFATLTVGATGELQAAPVLINTTAISATTLSTVTDVRWRGWRGGWGGRRWWGPGVVIGGLALGAAPLPYYYGGPYYYSSPYYYRCYTNDGQRRFRPCEQGGN